MIAAREKSVGAAMFGQVLALRNRIDKPEDLNARLRVKSIQQDSGGAVVAGELELRIVGDDVAVVLDAKLAADLQDDSRGYWCGCRGPEPSMPTATKRSQEMLARVASLEAGDNAVSRT